MPEPTDAVPFEAWALIEIMGHVRLAGKVTEQVIAGASFLRVDVPEVGELAGFTKFYGAAAIYSISPVDEATARHAAAAWHVRPVETYVLPGLPAPSREAEDDERDD